MNSTIFSACPIGIKSYLVNVEICISNERKGFFIIGLPGPTIKESGKRIMTALKNSGFPIERSCISVNLAPATLRKEGSFFDLAIAMGILQSYEYINIDPQFLNETLFIGELSFDGSVKSIHGALVIATQAKSLHKKRIIISEENAQEAALALDIEIIGVKNIKQIIRYIKNPNIIERTVSNIESYKNSLQEITEDFNDIKGQYAAKRSLQIAAAGRHNVLFSGPPGSGKTMLARRIITLMPAMTFKEIIETTKIYSMSQNLDKKSLIMHRQFRSPHHSSSIPSLLGGGSSARPGEISLAHNGILFLDELLEFKSSTLDSLRQPLESGETHISRVAYNVTYPCKFILIAALNPCPCGYLGDKKVICKCSAATIRRYKDKLSGPLYDRIDMKVAIESVTFDESQEKIETTNVSSKELKIGVNKALEMQYKRFKNKDTWNNEIKSNEIEIYCKMTPEAEEVLKYAFIKMNMSMRTYHKIIKVSRTIADIEESELIQINHIKEAIIFKT